MSEDLQKGFCNLFFFCWPLWCFLSLNNYGTAYCVRAGKQAFLLYEGEVPCLTWAGADLAVRKKACQRRNLVSSAISAAALISTTLKTVRLRHRCWRSRPTQLTMAAGEKNAPIAIPARCSGTGQLTAMTMRPSNATHGWEDGLSVHSNWTIYTTSICVLNVRKRDSVSWLPLSNSPCPSTPESVNW